MRFLIFVINIIYNRAAYFLAWQDTYYIIISVCINLCPYVHVSVLKQVLNQGIDFRIWRLKTIPAL